MNTVKNLSGFLKIKKQIQELELTKLEAKKLLTETEENIEQKKLGMAQYYQEFFDKKRKTEFVLYDRFPSTEALDLYIRNISDKFPLYEVGSLDAKELAELIKHCYQFKTDSEYDILTIGANELVGTPVYQGQSWSVKPHLYFVVGNNKTLAPFRQYDGQFINENKVYTSIYLHAMGKNLLSLDLTMSYKSPKIDIECLTGHSDIPEKINFYNYEDRRYEFVDFNKYKNIFAYYLIHRVGKKGKYGYNGIKDVLDFTTHISDTFIARILISICIYKRNNNIDELSNEDYNHIFDVLYGTKTDIKDEASKDIPNRLIYVPNQRHGR